MSGRCLAPSISPTVLVEPLEGNGFEAPNDSTTITISGCGAVFGVIGRG
ncbi:MAG: hypothetical protein OEU92_35200 [Alphaproteobacteria bacterium]|nr:hypothetical protein [Alphaproteobacteria bacterium]